MRFYHTSKIENFEAQPKLSEKESDKFNNCLVFYIKFIILTADLYRSGFYPGASWIVMLNQGVSPFVTSAQVPGDLFYEPETNLAQSNLDS